ncbi:MAG: hypothetical protein MR531_03715 [Lachnospiraceae bacterium]|nr:hypothetical protein [Lachnospiraceae bacterium]
MQNSKVRLITPLLMLFAGALASIIMYIRKYDFYKMLWVLLIVLVVFYIIGDIVRYLYESVRPNIIPTDHLDEMLDSIKNEVVEMETDEESEAEDEEIAEDEEAESEADMLRDNDLDDEPVEEYTDENLDEM